MSAPWIALIVVVVVAACALAVWRRPGRFARHEDGDRLAKDYFTERSGPDGGSS